MKKDTVNVNGIEVRPEGVLKNSAGDIGVILHHIVGEDGLSDRERNRQKTHAIPLFSLVEIQCNSEEDGLRLYVQGHSRDCDGTPLYELTYDYKIVGKDVSTERLRAAKDRLEHMIAVIDTGKVSGGYPEHCLTVIKTADEVKKRLIEKGYMDENEQLI